MLSLPYRAGEKPKTSPSAPHEQLDQNPPANVYALLKDRAFDSPQVDRRPSIISVPGAEGLWLTETPENRCEEAFMAGNEFAHVHPPYDGSLHLMLPVKDTRELFDKGWGEPHPLVPYGRLPETAVMVFGPRDEAELGAIMNIIKTSYQFARGGG
jgi:hypothetical protein